MLRLYDYLESGNSYKVRRLQRAQALTVMDRYLAERRFYVGDGCSVAELALYAYTRVG